LTDFGRKVPFFIRKAFKKKYTHYNIMGKEEEKWKYFGLGVLVTLAVIILLLLAWFAGMGAYDVFN